MTHAGLTLRVNRAIAKKGGKGGVTLRSWSSPAKSGDP